MHTWRRQTIVVGICFAAVVLARFYFKHIQGGQGPAAASGQALDPQDVARDTVVTLDTNP